MLHRHPANTCMSLILVHRFLRLHSSLAPTFEEVALLPIGVTLAWATASISASTGWAAVQSRHLSVEAWEHDPRQRAEQLPLPRKHRSRSRVCISPPTLPCCIFTVIPRARIRVKSTLSLAASLHSPLDWWSPSSQDRQVAFSPFSMELLGETTSLQAGMTRWQQLVSSLDHDGQATHVIARDDGCVGQAHEGGKGAEERGEARRG